MTFQFESLEGIKIFSLRYVQCMEATNQQPKSLGHESESLTPVEELDLEVPKQGTQICRVKMNQSFFESCGLRRKMDQIWIRILNPNL